MSTWRAGLLASFWSLYTALLLQYLHLGLLWKGFSWWGAGGWVARAALAWLLPVLAWGALGSERRSPWRTWVLVALAAVAALGELAWSWGSSGLLLAHLAVGVVPGWLFFYWTQTGAHPHRRTLLHGSYYAPIMLLLIPAACMEFGGGGWAVLGTYPGWLLQLLLQLLLLPALFLLNASQEFAAHGGTPMPWDPPPRLVTTGAFAYVANPMQVGKWGLLAGWGLLLGQAWVVAVATLGALYSLAWASPNEERALPTRLGAAWSGYRQQVRRWRIRWRPFHLSQIDPQASPARLYLDLQCSACHQMADWFREQRPTGMEVMDLHQQPRDPSHPWQILYDPGDGRPQERGLRALAKGLEHIHLGWALIGWAICLPLLHHLWQRIYAVAIPPPPDACPAPPQTKT